MEVVIAAVATLIVGFIIGCITGALRVTKNVDSSLSGDLVIDANESTDRPDMYLNNCLEPSIIAERKYVTLRVVNVKPISQK